jgi:catechol 2,3-dioxygenase-like lactoylglutathione lyase family enzyme
MQRSDLPAPESGFVITHFLVVDDQDAARDFYVRVLGAEPVVERDPVIMKVANTWLILNVGGPPTEDKPEVTLAVPDDLNLVNAFMNIRVADIAAFHEQTTTAGAQWLTPPMDRGGEIRGYIRDPDGHLIEVGQATGILGLLDE